MFRKMSLVARDIFVYNRAVALVCRGQRANVRRVKAAQTENEIGFFDCIVPCTQMPVAGKREISGILLGFQPKIILREKQIAYK